MATHVIKKDQTATVSATDSNSSWLVAKGVTLSGAPAFLDEDLQDVRVTLEGRMITTGYGFASVGPSGGEATDKTSLVVGASGRITAGEIAVLIEGGDSSVKNEGTIKAANTAVYVEGFDIVVENSGKVVSEANAAIATEFADVFLIRNDGLLRGDSFAVYMADGHGRLINGKDGVIDGSVYMGASSEPSSLVNKGQIAGETTAVTLGGGDDRLVNRGEIDGGIRLRDGNDLADLRKGTFANAIVEGGDGDDTFVIDRADIEIVELDGGGADTIKTTVSYILGVNSDDYVETLTAIGKANVDLTGNFRDNTLNGNRAGNSLNGGGGTDHLSGLGGNDELIGAGGADHFYFQAKTGIDTIVDFTLGEDKIHIIEIDGISDIGDIADHMIAKDFNGDGVEDTVINLGGGDRIRLDGIVRDSLGMDDFVIVT